MSIINIFERLLQGVPTTLYFIIISWIFGFLLGILVTAGRVNHHKWLNYILGIYISFTRSVPIILQLFLVYYGLPALLLQFGIDLSFIGKMYFCVVAYVIYYGAYLSEVLRPAYLSVSESQHEVGLALGYTKWQTQIKIIIPQAIPIVLPALGNETINLIHQSSLLFIIGIVDLMGQADSYVNEEYLVSPVLVYFCAGLIYWLLTIIIGSVVRLAEHKFGKFLYRGGEY